jgi:hypothetical protein
MAADLQLDLEEVMEMIRPITQAVDTAWLAALGTGAHAGSAGDLHTAAGPGGYGVNRWRQPRGVCRHYIPGALEK